ncbi:HIR complex subunit [Rhizina undulata]
MSSASTGPPYKIPPGVQHSVHLSSKPTSPTATHGVVTSGPNNTGSSRNSNPGSSNNHNLLSSSSSSSPPHNHRPQRFPHDVVDPVPTQNAQLNTNPRKSGVRADNPTTHPSRQSREVIDLVDDPTPDATTSAGKLNGSHLVAPVSKQNSLLQPPFDPIPRGSSATGSAKFGHRASASPSISSLIDPQPPPQPRSSVVPSQPSTSTFSSEPVAKKVSKPDKPSKTNDNADSINRSPISKANTAPSSAAPSPKPARQSLPSGSGNGLLSNVLPGGGSKEAEYRLPNIHIHVPLNGETNKYVNFAKLAEERYGWAAMNPRLARAREKLMADSGDEMMLDGSESESNVEMDKPMGGMGNGDSTAEQKKSRKRKNQDIYDKADPFIDDSELLWEEQAAASKDGFFVYSGPLVPEGEKPQVERADGTIKRGRGRGRGSNTRGTTSTRGTTVRKPRLTKKDKEKMEREKEERERFSLNAAAKAAVGH